MTLSSMPATRRSFLGLTGAAATAAALGEAALADPAAAEPVQGAADLRFAVVTDTHANVDVPTRTAALRRLLTHIESRQPDVVLNCGDLTDYGVDGEFAAYRSAVPDTLWSRMRHVAGNHEWRWDISAMESYRRWFGEPTDSFDLGGLHFVGLSPYQLLEEPSVYGAELLAWLRKDLDRRTNDTVPAILFTHMPIGAPNYYVNDSEDLLEVLEKRNVRALFTGHTHTHEIMPMNGFTQVNGRASRDGIDYFWVERVTRDGRPELTVDAVRLAADGSTTTSRSAVIPLRGARVGGHLAPNSVRADVEGEAITVEVRMSAARAGEVDAMVAQIYPQARYGGRQTPTTVELTRTDTGTFKALVAMVDLTPGHHRVQVRAVDAAGEFWESIVPVFVDGAAAHLGWVHRVGGQVQAGIMAVGEATIVAASTTGSLTSLRVDGDRTRVLWRTRIGPVHRDGAVHDGVIYLPSADHHLYAVEAATGAVRWRVDLGAPALARTLAVAIDARTDIIACAGTETFRITTQGAIVWRTDHGNLFAGRPACDGERVYVGSGDGRAYAFDARTGARLWRADLATNRSDAYGKMLYAPWGTRSTSPRPIRSSSRRSGRPTRSTARPEPYVGATTATAPTTRGWSSTKVCWRSRSSGACCSTTRPRVRGGGRSRQLRSGSSKPDRCAPATTCG